MGITLKQQSTNAGHNIKRRLELGTSGISVQALERARELEVLLKKLREITKKPTEGKLRVQKRGKTFQYYLRTSPEDTEGVYLKKRDRAIAEKITTYEYYLDLITEIEKELAALYVVVELCDNERILELHSLMHPGKQVLVEKVMLSDEDFAKNWEQVEYSKMGFSDTDLSDYFTSKGERVRSKSEIVIADALARKGVPYRYEYPMELSNVGMVRPDFCCLNKRTRKEILWEHLGMMSDYDYANKNVRKIENYEANGFFLGDNLIVTMETDSCFISTRLINQIIEKYLI